MTSVNAIVLGAIVRLTMMVPVLGFRNNRAFRRGGRHGVRRARSAANPDAREPIDRVSQLMSLSLAIVLGKDEYGASSCGIRVHAITPLDRGRASVHDSN